MESTLPDEFFITYVFVWQEIFFQIENQEQEENFRKKNKNIL